LVAIAPLRERMASFAMLNRRVYDSNAMESCLYFLAIIAIKPSPCPTSEGAFDHKTTEKREWRLPLAVVLEVRGPSLPLNEAITPFGAGDETTVLVQLRMASRQQSEEIACRALTLQSTRSVLSTSGRGAGMGVVLTRRSIRIADIGFIHSAPPTFRFGVANEL
jgi:hypothetical protein